MRPIFLIALVALLPATALAAPQPSEQDKLFAALAKADSPETAHPIEEKLTALFRVSGSPTVDLLMGRVQASLAAADNDTAGKLLEAVTRAAPGYAEAWHQRAQMQEAAGDDAAAMVSLQKTVLLNPRYFMALAQLGAMLEDYGDKNAALKLYRQALALDPQLDDVAKREAALAKGLEGQGI